jgi:broad specificity phosphatase PhoE
LSPPYDLALRRPLSIVLAAACLLAPGCASPDRYVFLTRHAEKEAGRDPSLSADGKARADALAERLAGSGIEAIYVTQFRRTRETAEPLAHRLGVEIEVIEVSADLEVHAASVAEACRTATASSVLVIGHSNTIPAIVHALTGETIEAIPDDRYGDVWTISLDRDGRGKLVQPRCGGARSVWSFWCW